MPLSPDRVRWNRRYSDASFVPDWAPDVFLAQRLPELPRGRALDLACGVGANSLFLAKRGYEVTAVDMSDVAIERLRRAAASEGVLDRIEPALADAMDYDLEPQAYDLALCFRFFFPELAGKLASSLKHGGMLLCKVFTSEQLRYRPDWPADRVVAPGSLPGFFPELETIVHEESSRPEDAYAVLLARRPE